MSSSMMTISLSKENERLKSDMESLQNENTKLKTELNHLTGELEQRDKLITSLECQIRALLKEQTRPTNNNNNDSSSSSTENSPTTKLHNNNNNNNSENDDAKNNNNIIIRPKGRSKPSQGIVHVAKQLLPPQRSNMDMETPLAPDFEEREIEKDDKEKVEETTIKKEKEEEEAKDEINKGEADGERIVDPSFVVAKEDGKIIGNQPKKEEEEEKAVSRKPGKTTTTKQKNNVPPKEEQKGDSSRPILKPGLKSNRNAIKALPREISISNDDDDELTKYSIESSPIVEVEKAKMRDAYGVRGIYTGTISRLDKFPHGKGTMEYEDGKIYEGEWHRGHWHGKCSMKSSKGVYTGRVVNDLKEGDGELFYVEGHKFKGKFEQDEPVEGTMTYADKRQYVGKLRNNVMHGKGVLTYPDGSKYSGEFQNGVQHGKGVYHFSDGSVYEGESVMGVYEGNGKMTWNDGGWYEGEWKQGEANGHGMEIRSDGTLRHHGKWRKGVPVRN